MLREGNQANMSWDDDTGRRTILVRGFRMGVRL